MSDGDVVRRSHLSAALVMVGYQGGYGNGEPASVTIDSRESQILIVLDQLAHLHGWATALGVTRTLPRPDDRISVRGLVSGWTVTLDYVDPEHPLGDAT